MPVLGAGPQRQYAEVMTRTHFQRFHSVSLTLCVLMLPFGCSNADGSGADNLARGDVASGGPNFGQQSDGGEPSSSSTDASDLVEDGQSAESDVGGPTVEPDSGIESDVITGVDATAPADVQEPLNDSVSTGADVLGEDIVELVDGSVDAVTALDTGSADAGGASEDTGVDDSSVTSDASSVSDGAQWADSGADPDSDMFLDSAGGDGMTEPSEPDATDAVPPSVVFLSPEADKVFAQGKAVSFSAMVSPGDTQLDGLAWTLVSDVDGLLAGGDVGLSGYIEVTSSTMTPGWHTVTLTVLTGDTEDVANDALKVGICKTMTPDDFDADIEQAGWKLYGDAYWDTSGWLELTGLAAGGGSIYKVSETLSAADAVITFDFYTGGGINGGADGFAMTVIDVDDEQALEDYIATAKNGGCLGYGASGTCGDMVVEAFHLEIDTFYNTGDPFYDPTSTNHIAVTLDGDPENHILIASGLYLEDSQWHNLEIIVTGEHVVVNLDGDTVIEDDIPGLSFRGGYIGFSGSTGWATNWHRVDNLSVDQECLVP